MSPALVTRLYQGTPHNLRMLGARLRRGELVAAPTETVYGLAGDAMNVAACEAIFAAKERPANDPLIVHVRQRAEAKKLTRWNDAAEAVARAFWPGPLTMVLPKREHVPDIVTSGRPSVAIRMPQHPLFRKLLAAADRPLAAPSANPFGYISPTTAQHVKASLGGRIRSILDGGPCAIGIESTIVDLRDPAHPTVLRPGAITADQLSRVLGVTVRAPKVNTVSHSQAADAPGMLERHYSPSTPLTLHDTLPGYTGTREARVYFHRADLSGSNEYSLSTDGSGESAARRMFAMLRELDAGDWSHIHLERVPREDPWAPSVNDRLRRAAARSS
ncbi:L-threonylcarbamoyladenylate synthase [Synoicihabitans lomoniglobus]|uniref:Threonylcarbamoyl-AMP synthase n=1 Tax=Synoicihabitans lomoniglobus TaxID=2909285 RepID=A0AAF0CR56_9BACT|nr:L-threonylcarbamoyladenylate synthase [Opitutaceae bacterium LMO-M01]